MAQFLFKTLLLSTQKRTFSALAPSFTVKYLVESCGLSSKSALSLSQKLQLNEEDIEETESVISLLKAHGFDDTHIVKIIEKLPKILRCRSDSTLKPKLEFLVQNGIVGQTLHDVVIRNPFILSRALSSHIKPSIEFLWQVLKTKERVVAAVNNAKIWPFQCNMKDAIQPNIDILKKEGVPDARIANFIAYRACTMVQKAERIAALVKTVKEFGIHPSAPTFLYAVHVRSAMSDSVWNQKVQIFESWGLSQEEIMSKFRRYPFVFGLSEKNLKDTMEFFVNTAKFKPEAIAAYPVLLTLSVDKRIRPRYNVYSVLMKEKLLHKKVKLSSLLLCRDEKFLKTYVTKHLDVVPSLMEIYNTAKNGSI